MSDVSTLGKESPESGPATLPTYLPILQETIQTQDEIQNLPDIEELQSTQSTKKVPENTYPQSNEVQPTTGLLSLPPQVQE